MGAPQPYLNHTLTDRDNFFREKYDKFLCISEKMSTFVAKGDEGEIM